MLSAEAAVEFDSPRAAERARRKAASERQRQREIEAALAPARPEAKNEALGASIAITLVALGLLICAYGVETLFGDNNVFGLYCYIPVGIALFVIAWGSRRP